jgi:hypothetical protein
MTKFARKCDITGEGMNEGFIVLDGMYYIKHEKDLVKWLRENYTEAVYEDYSDDYEFNTSSLTKRYFSEVESDEEVAELSYLNGIHYWTEWEDDDYEWEEIDGKLIEIE